MKTKMNNNIKIAYFGGEPLGVPALEALYKEKIIPELIICNPDRPSGRGQQLTPPPIKIWAGKHAIETFQPGSFDEDANLELLSERGPWDLFIVVAYNHILPKWLIELPKYKTINLHPSLLPKLRGPSPIRTAILENRPEQLGVSIMLMDEEMDHGPLLAQESFKIDEDAWPVNGDVLDKKMSIVGGELLAQTVKQWVEQKISPVDQNHNEATYTKKMTKAMAEISLDPLSLPTGEEAQQLLFKIKAMRGFPGTFFFYQEKRIKITDAEIDSAGKLKPLSVIPEGKKETDFTTWQSTLKS